jgi:PAS domain S-box-containing protein
MSATRSGGATAPRSDQLGTEEALRRSEADFARAQRQASIGNWRWSIPRDELLDCSDEYARIHGVEPDEIMEYQKRRVIHPDDLERVERTFREVDRSRSDYSIEYRIVRPDGEVRHVLEIGEATTAGSDDPDEQVGTLQDITELKRAQLALERAHDELEARVAARTAELQEREELLRTAARISRMGYAIWDEVTETYATVSEEYAQIFGYSVEEYLERFGTSEKDLIGIHPDDQARYVAFDAAFRAAPHEAEMEYRVALPGQPIQHFRDVVRPVFAESGQHVQTILAVQDITELKRTEEQLRQAQKMEAVGHLTGGIAHDFNNLLAVILCNLELIETSIDEKGEAPEWIQGAIAAAERGASLTQRLLAFSRKQALRPERVDAGQLVRSMHDLLSRTLGGSIEVELVTGAGLWLTCVDPSQLENSILNLAINARDAMAKGGVLTIEIANVCIDEDYALVQADVEPGQYVLVTVGDTGPGMAPEILEHAFEPFFTTKDVGQGSGLGLSMVHGFVNQSGGHVRISSEQDRGTAVEIYLPRHRGDDDELVDHGEVRALPRARGEAVLVVEDEGELRALVVRMLKSLGYDVREAGSGARALQLLESSIEVDLLITDVVLPGGLSGSELADEVARRIPDLPVLYMSGYTENAILRDGRSGEGIHFLQKPFRRVDIARAIRKALGATKS